MKGIVYKSTGSFYLVGSGGKFYKCRIKGKLRIEGIKSTNPVAVGDYVEFDIEKKSQQENGVIKNVLQRRNYIVRKSVNLSKQIHILAANIDYVFLVVTLNNPITTTLFIDRFLVTAEAYSIKTVLLFNKLDTYDQDELLMVKNLYNIYREIGYGCIGISAKTGKNMNKVVELMKNNTSLISGHSGCGKTSILNNISPELNLKTADISSSHNQGTHTTTFAQMFDLDFGGRVIDSPGIKGFGIVDMDKEEIGDYFPEILKIKNNCKYNNCTHTHEPDCAVLSALEQEKISQSRYRSYVQILSGEDQTYRQKQIT